MIKLLYIERDLTPVEVGADIVTRHPNESITFCITNPEWKTRIGWGPTSHVEVQAAPVGQVNLPDRYYWADQIRVVDSDQETLRRFLEMFSEAPDGMVDRAYTGLIKKALASSQTIDWVQYMRNLLDMMVHTAGGASMPIKALALMLDAHPETEVAKAERRKDLSMKNLEVT